MKAALKKEQTKTASLEMSLQQKVRAPPADKSRPSESLALSVSCVLDFGLMAFMYIPHNMKEPGLNKNKKNCQYNPTVV